MKGSVNFWVKGRGGGANEAGGGTVPRKADERVESQKERDTEGKEGGENDNKQQLHSKEKEIYRVVQRPPTTGEHEGEGKKGVLSSEGIRDWRAEDKQKTPGCLEQECGGLQRRPSGESKTPKSKWAFKTTTLATRWEGRGGFSKGQRSRGRRFNKRTQRLRLTFPVDTRREAVSGELTEKR